MSVDVNFWKTKEGVEPDPAAVYEAACCEGEDVPGLEDLPAAEILEAAAAAFPDWKAVEPGHFENPNGPGAFEASVTRQAARFDCYGMEPAEIRRLSAVMAGFGCPLYDAQLGVRFDKIELFLVEEADAYRAEAEEALRRLLPGLEIHTAAGPWADSAALSKTSRNMQCHITLHRGKKQTKVTAFLQFGRGWTNRPCPCKNERLAADEARVLGELVQKSIGRAVEDLLARSYFVP